MVQMVSSSPALKVEAEAAAGSSSSMVLGRLNKRAKLDSSLQARYEPLEESSPLGLRLKKTPSLLDLVQSKLSSHGRKKDHRNKGSITNNSADGNKLKASNFPASLLRIGDWEYKSRYEGDLVGKCYFAKHKLVWEVLDGGLKNKIEIQWSDIIAIKGDFSEDDDDQAETLNVVLSRAPLFFRETNPQPRKHTLWQASADFTGGQASLHKQHYLECQHGFLRKHFEKLVQCDPRLNILSQRPMDIPLGSPYFEHTASAFGDLNEPMDVKSEDCCIFTGASGETTCQKNPSTITGIDTMEGVKVNSSITGDPCHQTNPQKLQPSMSIDDLLNYIGHCTSELRTGNHPLKGNILEEITRHLLSDSQFTTDEESVMSRVNSLCCLLQKDRGAARDLLTRSQSDIETGSSVRTARSNNPAPLHPASQMKSAESPQGEERKSVFRNKAVPLISSDNSVGELLNLPRIASLPRFLPNM